MEHGGRKDEAIAPVVREALAHAPDDLSVEQRRAIRRELEAMPRSDDTVPQAVEQTLAVPHEYLGAQFATWKLHGTEHDQNIQERVRRVAIAYVATIISRSSAVVRHVPMVVGWRGAFGTGKTMMAWIVGRNVFAEGHSVRITTAQDMIGDIRSAWVVNAKMSDRQKVHEYRWPYLLVIDEVTRAHLTNEPTKHLHDVIAARQEHRRPTILITNDDERTFCETIGGSIADRLRGSSDVWYFGQRSYRPLQRRTK